MFLSRKAREKARAMASNACPICSRHFRPENLAMHVEFCLTKGSSGSTVSSAASSPFAAFPAAKKRATPASFGAKQRPAPPPVVLAPNGASSSAKAAGQDQEHEQAPGSASKKRKRLGEPSGVPLAERMRPSSLTDLVGQDEVVGPGKALAALIGADRVHNMILWGPPGCGKTTLAHVIARKTTCKFIALSGSTSSAADMKEALERARGERKLLNRRTILFVDEIHRFNKNQQDILLPAVEDGTVTLIGATTENPSFELRNALLSRCRVYTLQKHSTESISKILHRALEDHESGGLLSLLGPSSDAEDLSHSEIAIVADDDAIAFIANQCGGDARVALNCLEIALQTATVTNTSNTSDRANGPGVNSTSQQGTPASKHVLRLTEAHVRHCFAHRQTLLYDRKADFHYDLISALHKSVRGSDPNGALYWLARMLEGGENPLYIARRLIRMASEDIGLAAPEMLPIAVSAYQAAHFLGMPECDVVLAQCTAMLARAPKSIEVYGAYKRVKQTIHEWEGGAQPDVPLHLRNAPTNLMKDVGYSKGYLYNPHHTKTELQNQTYLPDELLGTDFFRDEIVEEVRRRNDADESKNS